MGKIRLDQVVKQEGNRTNGFINFGQRADTSYYQIPVIIIEGGQPGPTLLVDACTHGDEHEGAEAILMLAKELEGQTFKGTFIGVPVLNVEAFSNISRASLSDGFNLNRIFPGNTETYSTHRLSAVYIERVVKHVDAVITFHGGGNVLHLEPLVGYLPPVDEVGEKCYEMAKAFNCRYTWRMQNLPFVGVSALSYKELYGIPTILPEVGSHCSRLHDHDKNVRICYDGIKNVMAFWGMIAETKKQTVDMMDIELHYLHSYNGGIQTLVKRENEIVEEGEVLAYMQDIFGNVIEELKAPYRGVVVGFWSVPLIRPGDWWSLFAKIL